MGDNEYKLIITFLKYRFWFGVILAGILMGFGIMLVLAWQSEEANKALISVISLIIGSIGTTFALIGGSIARDVLDWLERREKALE
jgi:hypothetical protein